MIDFGANHSHFACHVSRLEFRHMRKRSVAIVIKMRLYVAFVLEIYSVFVAQVIPVRAVGIMRIANVIYVGTFHEHHLFLHLLACNCVSALRICFVAVHTFEFHRAPIDIKISACLSEFVKTGGSVADFHLAKTGIGRESFHSTSFFVLKLSHEHITPWCFSRPRFYVRHGQLHFALSLSLFGYVAHFHGGFGYRCIRCPVAIKFHGI